MRRVNDGRVLAGNRGQSSERAASASRQTMRSGGSFPVTWWPSSSVMRRNCCGAPPLEPFAGAAETVRWARSVGIPYLFVTNTSSRSRADLVSKAANLGIASVDAEILTPTVALAERLRAARKGRFAFARPTARDEFTNVPLLADEDGAAYVVI